MSDEDVVTPRLEELPDEVEQKGAAQVSSPPKPTRAPKKKRSRRCPMCCGKFMAFFVFGIIVVPVAVFTISAFFALILWGLECSEAVDKSCTWEESDCICSYYQWWIYIVGNLVGVSITDVGPEAGHVLAELIDLLIAVWSLTVAGLVIGLVGSLAWVGMLTEGADGVMISRFDKILGLQESVNKEASEGGLDFDTFVSLCADKQINLPSARLREVFDAADVDSSGKIEGSEVGALIEKVAAEAEAMEAEPSVSELSERMDAMDKKLDKLVRLLEK